MKTTDKITKREHERILAVAPPELMFVLASDGQLYETEEEVVFAGLEIIDYVNDQRKTRTQIMSERFGFPVDCPVDGKARREAILRAAAKSNSQP